MGTDPMMLRSMAGRGRSQPHLAQVVKLGPAVLAHVPERELKQEVAPLLLIIGVAAAAAHPARYSMD